MGLKMSDSYFNYLIRRSFIFISNPEENESALIFHNSRGKRKCPDLSKFNHYSHWLFKFYPDSGHKLKLLKKMAIPISTSSNESNSSLKFSRNLGYRGFIAIGPS